MKINIRDLLIINLLLFAILAWSCNGNPRPGVSHPNSEAEKKSPGKIVFDQEIHNFGTLKDGEIVSFSFIFHNTGESAFKLIKGEKSCGCIELHYSADQIAPGGSSTVEIVLNTSGEWGNLIKEATLETSEGEKKVLSVGAYVENEHFNNNLNTQK